MPDTGEVGQGEFGPDNREEAVRQIIRHSCEQKHIAMHEQSKQANFHIFMI
jgi:hypothetical protein